MSAFQPKGSQAFEFDVKSLRSAGYRLDGLRLVRDFVGAAPADPETVPPHGNTGGTQSTVSLSISDLLPSSDYKVSVDALTLSGILRPEFDDELHILGVVVAPLFDSLGFTVSRAKGHGLHALVLEDSVYRNQYYQRAYDLCAYVPTPLGEVRVVCGWLMTSPCSRSSHHFTLRFSGQACRALGIAEGGDSLKPFVDFLKSANPALVGPWRITRLDVAVDDFKDSLGGILAVYNAYLTGGFTSRARTPQVDCRGPIFHKFAEDIRPTVRDDGSTLYIGKRKSGKYFRAYEKRKEQLKKGEDPFINDLINPLVRYEVEFKDGDYFIPADALLCPLALWAGAFPALSVLAERIGFSSEPMSLPRVPTVVVSSVGRALIRACRKTGRLVALARRCYIPDTKICQALVSMVGYGEFEVLSDQLRREVVHAFDLAAQGFGPIVLPESDYVPF